MPPNVVIFLAGNKTDFTEDRKVTFKEAQQFAQENELLFMETSAKTAMNVREMFFEIGKIKIKNYERSNLQFRLSKFPLTFISQPRS